jgi:hypothetical protein
MQVQEYEDVLYLARNLVLDGQFYWLVTGNIRQGPFCPHCYNRDGLLMRLSGDPGERYCTACRESFADMPRQSEKAAVVAQDFCDGGDFVPALEQSPRKAKVIPFGR